MKKVILTFVISVAFGAAYAQSTKAIVTSGSYVQIGDFNPSNATFTNLLSVNNVYLQADPHDLIYDAKNGLAIFQDQFKNMVVCKISGNNVTTRNISLNSTLMAPAYIPSEQKVICFNVQKEFNGYGSNEENLFLSSIDLKKGTTKNLMKFNDLSFDNVAAPFYGKVTIRDDMRMTTVEKEVAISKPIYIAEKDLYMVMVRDVTGTNRLYKVHVNSPSANVVGTRCEYNIIDMAYVPQTDIVKTLYFEKTGNAYQLKVGDYNFTTNTMTNIALVSSSFTTPQIDNGSIKFNLDKTQLYVSRFDGIDTKIYNLNIDNNQTNSASDIKGNVQYDFGFNESNYKLITRADIIGLFPNPSNGIVYFKNNSGVIPNSIKVYDNVGQLVRSIKVEEVSTQIEINLSGMATGIYHVAVDMPGEDFMGKVAITN